MRSREAGLPEDRTISPDLLTGLEGLESIDGLEPKSDIAWHWREEVWAFCCQLTVPPTPGGGVPTDTHWWVTVDQTYPAGSIGVYPAKEGGLTKTFPHQSHNEEGPSNRPWREGKLCLHVNIDALKRYGFDTEPRAAGERLRWDIERARAWLIAASRSELMAEGEPYELPDFRFGGGPRLAFLEDSQSLATWARNNERAGYVETRRFDEVLIAARFLDRSDRPVHAPNWGTMIQKAEAGALGLWVRFKGAPIIEPWQAPQTWHELCEQARANDLDLEKELLRLADQRLRSSGLDETRRPRHPLLVGFPIPDRIGGPMLRMHWIGFLLPRLAEKRDQVPGFRPGNPEAMMRRDRNQLHRLRPIPWFHSESWSDEELTGRGRLDENLRESNILLLGAGALGSAVAELLVRGGVRKLSIMDPEALAARNLVRHTLLLDNIGHNKAGSLASRLARIAPAVDVVGESMGFPEIPYPVEERVVSADIVLDATADDAVLRHLEALNWPETRTFVSLSFGFGCRRLYFFAVKGERFPRSRYVEVIKPWIDDDWRNVDERELPRDGVGCWQPRMPGAFHEVMLLAAAAVTVLNELMTTGDATDEPRFLVLEQERDEEGLFTGVRRLRGSAISDRNQ